ncbi:MAG TPA: hypothetical protein VGO40_20615 [Longimicrobium sp.]|nr:hypothetical protein [Longimicrobium sp.]
MRKIRLAVEDLRVESFATDAAEASRGTVYGREFTAGLECRTAQSGLPDCPGCQNSGVASCVWCQRDTETCLDCSWTNGDGAECYW